MYSREYCHLCKDMLVGLQSLEGASFELDVIDVDSDAALEHRYGERVPLLAHGEVELCHYHLDAEKVRAYLAEIR